MELLAHPKIQFLMVTKYYMAVSHLHSAFQCAKYSAIQH